MNDDHRYILSPHYTIPPPEKIVSIYAKYEKLPEEIRQLRDGEAFFLETSRGTQFLINPTIKLFIEAFTNPTTLKEVITSFAAKAGVDSQKILEVMENFFQILVKKKILLTEQDASRVTSLLEKETLTKPKFQPGDLINEFEVIRKISIRKITQLYLCKQNGSDTLKVIKLLIQPEESSDSFKEKSLKTFRQEFQLMKELTPHPNICGISDYNNEENYAVLEFIEGISLRKTIDKSVASFKEKLEIIKQVLTAIAYVQNKQIIHGDLHLSNFLINEDNQVKLIDFGMSNHTIPEENEVVRNGGIHECVPPERAKEKGGFGFLKKKADVRSEVFQMGVIIYYTLYGKYPFFGFTWKKLAHSIINDQLDFPTKTVENDPIPAFLLDLLDKALQKNPLDRYENVGEMLLYFNTNWELP